MNQQVLPQQTAANTQTPITDSTVPQSQNSTSPVIPTSSSNSPITTPLPMPIPSSSIPPNKPPDSISQNTPPHKKPFHLSVYIVALVMLLIGIVLGYFSVTEFPQNKISSQTAVTVHKELILPKDAVLIQSCSTNQGALYIRPSDIPIGPIYMVNNGQVVGLEYMLDRSQFLAGTAFNNLQGLDIKVDHINVYFEPQGHAGHTTPHYHVDLYTVGQSVEKKITCSDTQQSTELMNQMMNMGSSSASITPSTTVMETESPTPTVTGPQTMTQTPTNVLPSSDQMVSPTGMTMH